MLINSGTSQPADRGTLNTTIHHCWFDGSNTRNPRAGYGKIHVFNCLYNGNGYGIGLHSQTQVLAERNFFDKVKNPIKQMYREDPKDPHHGFCGGVDSIFRDCEGQRAIEGTTFVPKAVYGYEFALHDAVPACDRECETLDLSQLKKGKAKSMAREFSAQSFRADGTLQTFLISK
jgi:pectate lyase